MGRLQSVCSRPVSDNRRSTVRFVMVIELKRRAGMGWKRSFTQLRERSTWQQLPVLAKGRLLEVQWGTAEESVANFAYAAIAAFVIQAATGCLRLKAGAQT